VRDPVIIGLDPARPGADETVLVVGRIITATEVAHRMRGYAPRTVAVQKWLRVAAGASWDNLLNMKVPLIRRFRRKKRYRRLFPAPPRIEIDFSGTQKTWGASDANAEGIRMPLARLQ